MEEQRPAIVLSAVRRLAADHIRRGVMVDPKLLQDICAGRKG